MSGDIVAWVHRSIREGMPDARGCGAAECCGGGAEPVKLNAADADKDGSSLMDAQSLSSAVAPSTSSFDRVRRSRTWPIPENPEDDGDNPDEEDLSISDGASLAQQPALHRHRTLLSMQRRDGTPEDGGGSGSGGGGKKETRTRIKWTPSTGAIVYGDAGKAMPLSPAAGSLPGASFS